MTDDERWLGRVRRKLVETKMRWARDRRLMTGESADPDVARLPPGQRLVRDWPILDLGVRCRIPTREWRLAVDGAVAHPLSWGFDDLLAQPQTESVSDIHCVTSWSRFDNRWTGVRTDHVLALAAPLAEARHVVIHSYDGYTTNLTLERFAAPDVLLVHRWEGEPLAAEHGGPVRLVAPRWYFWKSAKWIQRIELITGDRPGFWETRGYHNEGDPWREERYG